MEIDVNAVRAAVRAARRHEVFHYLERDKPEAVEPVPKFVLGEIDDRILGEALDPLIAAAGPGQVIDALAPHKDDADIAEALWYVFFFGDPDFHGEHQRNMLTVFTEEEIVDAAVRLLDEFREDHFTDDRGLPQWGWSALWQHEYDGDDHLTNEQVFRILLAVTERIPMDDKILWMVGDGPISKAWADTEYRDRIKDLARTEPKVRRSIELDEAYWRDGADPYDGPSLEGLY